MPPSFAETLRSLTDRYTRYEASEIDRRILPADTMFTKLHSEELAMEHYLAVGRGAIDMIVGALLLARKPEVSSILDLASGAGRASRHLSRFFPQADLYVSDLDQETEAWAAEVSGATRFAVAGDFSVGSARKFDLIFVGSLLTHMSREMYNRILDWLIDALAPGGVLVATVHGRTHDEIEESYHLVPPEDWLPARTSWLETGFGYVETHHQLDGSSYGFTIAHPSWALQQVETNPDVRILGYQEAAWDSHQDLLTLQKLPR